MKASINNYDCVDSNSDDGEDELDISKLSHIAKPDHLFSSFYISSYLYPEYFPKPLNVQKNKYPIDFWDALYINNQKDLIVEIVNVIREESSKRYIEINYVMEVLYEKAFENGHKELILMLLEHYSSRLIESITRHNEKLHHSLIKFYYEEYYEILSSNAALRGTVEKIKKHYEVKNIVCNIENHTSDPESVVGLIEYIESKGNIKEISEEQIDSFYKVNKK